MSTGRVSMLWMVAFAAVWALVEAIAAEVLRSYSPYQVVWTRYAVHVGLMLALWGWREPASLWHTRRPLYQFARSMLMLGMPASWIIGLQHGLSFSTQTAVFWISPLLILALASLVLGERAPLRHWLAAAVACAGAVLISHPSEPGSLQLLVFPLAMALTFSLYIVMTRSLRSETTRANLFYSALGVLLALSPFIPSIWITPSPQHLLVMAAIGVLGFVALYAVDRMAASAPVSVSAPLACLQLGFTLIVARTLGHGHADRLALAGLALVAGAALYVWYRDPAVSAVAHEASS
ncbi:MAG: DMT family transporter [Pseudomonadota bacterium]